jgi:ketopantoate reductase
MRILVLGAGVIGSVYAGRLLEAGHEVVLMCYRRCGAFAAVESCGAGSRRRRRPVTGCGPRPWR